MTITLRLTAVMLCACVALLLAALGVGQGLPARQVAYTLTRPSRADIWLLDVRTGVRVNLTAHLPTARHHTPVWSPDGAWLLFHAEAPAPAIDTRTWLYLLPLTPWRAAPLTLGAGSTASFAPDGTLLASDWAFLGYDMVGDRMFRAQLLARPVPTTALAGAPRVSLPPPTTNALQHTPVAAPDGTLAYVENASRSFSVVHVAGLPRTSLPPPLGFYSKDPAWAPDGTRLALWATDAIYAPSAQAGLYVLDLASGQAALRVGGFVGSPSWSPDGRTIVYDATDGPMPIYGQRWSLWSVAADGTRPPRRLLTPPPGALATDPAWRPRPR